MSSLHDLITAANAPIVQAWAEAFTAGVALAALLLGSIQILYIGAGHRRELLRRRDNAEALWREYEQRCFENPKMATPEDTDTPIDIDKFLFDNSKDKFIEYEYFVSLLLYACDGIIDAYGSKSDWRRSVEDEIGWHWQYLTSDYFEQYIKTTSPKVEQLIRDLKKKRQNACDLPVTEK